MTTWLRGPDSPVLQNLPHLGVSRRGFLKLQIIYLKENINEPQIQMSALKRNLKKLL